MAGYLRSKISDWVGGRLLGELLFFVLFFLYVWRGVDLSLIYHGGGVIESFPVFFAGWSFFQKLVVSPGGPVEYLAGFLGQLWYFSWAGAVVVTVTAWSISKCTDAIVKAVKAEHLRWVRFAGPLILLVIYSRYTHHFVTTIALLVPLCFVCGYLRMVCGRKGRDLVVYLLMSVVLFYLAAGGYFVFAVVCVIYELLFTRRWKMGVVYALLAAAVAYIEGVVVFDMCIIDAFGGLLPFHWKFTSNVFRSRLMEFSYILFLLVPLTVFLVGLWRFFFRARGKKNQKRQRLSWCFGNYKLKIVNLCVLMAVITGVFFASHDKKAKAVLQVDYYAYKKNWPAVLKAAEVNPTSYFVVNAVNQALYHTGRLGYDLFKYPQDSYTLFLTADGHEKAYWKKYALFLDTGLTNLAEHNLNESLALMGDRPAILKELAIVSMAQGDINSARVYLGALGKTMFYSRWAEHYLKLIDSKGQLDGDERIQQLRALLPEKDYSYLSLNIEDTMGTLLEKNKHNRMAFEYLMSSYLVTNRLGNFIDNLYRMKDFYYPEIPQLWQEAILVYILGTGRKVDLYGHTISAESVRRANDFNRIMRLYGGNKRAAYAELARKYSNSYLLYAFYATSGVKK